MARKYLFLFLFVLMLSLSAVSADESVGGMDTLAIDDGASCSVDNVQLQSFSDQQTVDDGGKMNNQVPIVELIILSQNWMK